jgi:hypothetical protein
MVTVVAAAPRKKDRRASSITLPRLSVLAQPHAPLPHPAPFLDPQLTAPGSSNIA